MEFGDVSGAVNGISSEEQNASNAGLNAPQAPPPPCPDEDWDMESCECTTPHPENQQHLVGTSVSTQTEPYFRVPVIFAPESWSQMEQLLEGTGLAEYSGKTQSRSNITSISFSVASFKGNMSSAVVFV
jgi:hypothetical protein